MDAKLSLHDLTAEQLQPTGKIVNICPPERDIMITIYSNPFGIPSKGVTLCSRNLVRMALSIV